MPLIVGGCFFVFLFFFYDGEVVMEDGLGVFFSFSSFRLGFSLD